MTVKSNGLLAREKGQSLAYDDEHTGLNLYEFEHINGDGACYRGVMADEVERVMPDAVVTLSSGYQAVNYAAIGIALKEA